MRYLGTQGVHRRRKWTTIRSPESAPAPDRVHRNFCANGPGDCWSPTSPSSGAGRLHLSGGRGRRLQSVAVGWSMANPVSDTVGRAIGFGGRSQLDSQMSGTQRISVIGGHSLHPQPARDPDARCSQPRQDPATLFGRPEAEKTINSLAISSKAGTAAHDQDEWRSRYVSCLASWVHLGAQKHRSLSAPDGGSPAQAPGPGQARRCSGLEAPASEP